MAANNRELLSEGSARRITKLYKSSLETQQVFQVADEFRALVFAVSNEAAADGSCPSSEPSKAYKRVRAFLQDAKALRLFKEKALALPDAWNCCNALILKSNLGSLQALLLTKEFSKILHEAGTLQTLQPLLLHTVEWLETKRFAKQGSLERLILSLVLEGVENLVHEDSKCGAEFLHSSGVLARIRLHLPWKRTLSGLNCEQAVVVANILWSTSALVASSVYTSFEKGLEELAAYAILGWAQGVLGWAQGVLLWAVAAKGTDIRAREVLDDLIASMFVQLSYFLRVYPMEFELLRTELQKMAPARAAAQKVMGGVRRRSGDVAKAFLDTVRNAEAFCAAQDPTAGGRVGVRAGPEEARVAHPGLLKEWDQMKRGTSGGRLIETRRAADVIGVDGEFWGTWEEGDRSAGPLDWEQAVRVIESGHEERIRALLPRLARYCADAKAVSEIGGVMAAGEVLSEACAEGLMALLESGKFSALLQEPGALGTLFLILHVAICPPGTWAPGSENKEQESFQMAVGARLMGWVRPRVKRLCLQSLLMTTRLLKDVINVTWAVKEFAVFKAGYLKYGFSLFELLRSTTDVAHHGANASLWSAGLTYLAHMIRKSPSQESELPAGGEHDQRLRGLQIAAIERGILDWAVAQLKVVGSYETAAHKELLAAVMEMAALNERGREQFDASKTALKALVDETAHGVKALAILGAATELHGMPSSLDCITLQLTTCWLLLTSDDVPEKTIPRWSQFLAAKGLTLLKLALGKREVLVSLVAEYPASAEGLRTALGLAERLWEKAAGEAGLRGCANPACDEVEELKGEFKRCGRCKEVGYCGQSCQVVHWRHGHKKMCIMAT